MKRDINIDFDKLSKQIDDSKSIRELSSAVNSISNALDKTCKNIHDIMFEYYLRNYLTYHYLQLNKTRYEIAQELDIPRGSLSNYLRKYKLIKTHEQKFPKERAQKIKESNLERYGVEHTSQHPLVKEKWKNSMDSRPSRRYKLTYKPRKSKVGDNN